MIERCARHLAVVLLACAAAGPAGAQLERGGSDSQMRRLFSDRQFDRIRNALQQDRLDILLENQQRDLLRFKPSPFRVDGPIDFAGATGMKAPGLPEAIDRCQVAARAFIDYTTLYGNRGALLPSVRKKLLAGCMTPVAPGGAENTPGSERVGSLTLADEPLCTAFRVERNLILTARHCIWLRDGNLNPAFRASGHLGALRFVPALAPQTSYKVAAVDCDGEPDSCQLARKKEPVELAGDIFLLKILGAPHLPMPVFASDVAAGESLFVIGASSLLSGRNKAPYQPEFVGMARDVGCVAGAVDNACVYHGCIVLPSFSGAPVFRVTRGTVQIVGMHLEGTGASLSCRGDRIREAGNVALRYGYGQFKQ